MAEMTTLQFDILAALALGRRHGYALVEEVGRGSTRKPGVATVYAALVKLEAAGLIEPAGEEVVDGRVRRYFVITRTGAFGLAEQADRMTTRARSAITSLDLGGALA